MIVSSLDRMKKFLICRYLDHEQPESAEVQTLLKHVADRGVRVYVLLRQT